LSDRYLFSDNFPREVRCVYLRNGAYSFARYTSARRQDVVALACVLVRPEPVGKAGNEVRSVSRINSSIVLIVRQEWNSSQAPCERQKRRADVVGGFRLKAFPSKERFS
jgi:hypothetical protein